MDYEEFDGLDEYEADEFDVDEGFAGEEFSDFDELADAAMSGDEEAEDEFLGALGGLFAKALPMATKILPNVLPQVFKWGKKLLRGGSRRAVRRAPRVARKAARVIARRPRAYGKNPRQIALLLNRLTKQLLQQL